MGQENFALAQETRDEGLAHWQTQSRPFMVWMLIVLTAFFFIASLMQLIYLHWEIAHPPILGQELLDDAICATPNGQPLQAAECLTLKRGQATLLLEANVVARRYHQSNAIVMFSVWSRYLGFVTGMILAMVGSVFILGKLSEPPTRIEAGAGHWKANFSSASPGLVMCLLGVVLIIASITTLSSLQTRDAPTYFVANQPGRVFDDGSPIGGTAQARLPSQSP
jgi:hypothetical protein